MTVPYRKKLIEVGRRIKMAYPVHPELFDRLFNDWSTLDKFQRTRGVLRLMAAVIHSLWERTGIYTFDPGFAPRAR
jgi:predicted AAA+ superfamily ATPase